MRIIPLFLITASTLIMSGCNNNKAHNSLDSDSLAQYRDTLIGKFNGIEIDTLICEPIDSLSPIEDGTYGGCHYEWKVYSTNGTVKDLIVGNTIGIDFIKEGDLDGNGTEEWGYITQWPNVDVLPCLYKHQWRMATHNRANPNMDSTFRPTRQFILHN